ERLGPDVDGRHGEAMDVAPGAGHVEILDARRPRAQRLGHRPDEPLGDLGGRGIGGEGGRPGKVADAVAPERRLVVDDDRAAIEVEAASEALEQPGGGGGDEWAHPGMVPPQAPGAATAASPRGGSCTTDHTPGCHRGWRSPGGPPTTRRSSMAR